MTSDELRDLLELVEAHGGPVSLGALDDNGDPIIWADGFSLALSRSGLVADHLIGVLKRDLIERGAVEVLSGSVMMHDPQRDGLYGFAEVSFPQQLESHYECHDSELEALLRAYIAAAKGESWGDG